MIKDSPGFYYTMAALHCVVVVIMLFAAYWAYGADRMMHAAFSVSMAIAAGCLARALGRRARMLREKEPIQLPETTRGK